MPKQRPKAKPQENNLPNVNIFEFFRASGKAYWIDEKKGITYHQTEGGCQIIPHDGSYKHWISESWYWVGNSPLTFLDFNINILDYLRSNEYRESANLFYEAVTHPPTTEQSWLMEARPNGGIIGGGLIQEYKPTEDDNVLVGDLHRGDKKAIQKLKNALRESVKNSEFSYLLKG